MEEIDRKKYLLLHKEHKSNLVVGNSFTDITGHDYDWSKGNPQWMTEWNLKDSKKPFLRAESETVNGKTSHKYFLLK